LSGFSATVSVNCWNAPSGIVEIQIRQGQLVVSVGCFRVQLNRVAELQGGFLVLPGFEVLLAAGGMFLF
jgi:hypothetical protein